MEDRLRHSIASAPHKPSPPGHWPNSVGDLPLVLTEPELARVRGVSIRTLQRDRCRGASVPFKKVGRKVFYSRDDVLSFFRAPNWSG